MHHLGKQLESCVLVLCQLALLLNEVIFTSSLALIRASISAIDCVSSSLPISLEAETPLWASSSATWNMKPTDHSYSKFSHQTLAEQMVPNSKSQKNWECAMLYNKNQVFYF